ncbi:MAG: DUF1622 domain-containing protein [Defluviicoccus sp.]|nr:DUF1622 domain-containing protein [Defluviicoccus sp.]MDG4593311.1 DUF1622 domain-containing protein [Defluviicoccus sp.]
MTELAHLLGGVAEALKLVLEGAALIAVICGIVSAASLAASVARTRSATALIDLRIRFGSWLAVALEFQLGADIVATTVGPSADALMQLGLVALIRTFLNFFLGRELAEQAKLKQAITTPTATGT